VGSKPSALSTAIVNTLRSYLNNPEVMSGAAFFGLALVSGSKFVLFLAVIKYMSHWWFLSKVEK
jgi:hypothetical protein